MTTAGRSVPCWGSQGNTRLGNGMTTGIATRPVSAMTMPPAGDFFVQVATGNAHTCALSNAGVWVLGRLQTDADRERVLEGLGEGGKKSALSAMLKKLAQRWFVVRDARDDRGPTLLQPRWAMSYLRGPMTREEIKRACADPPETCAAKPEEHT